MAWGCRVDHLDNKPLCVKCQVLTHCAKLRGETHYSGYQQRNKLANKQNTETMLHLLCISLFLFSLPLRVNSELLAHVESLVLLWVLLYPSHKAFIALYFVIHTLSVLVFSLSLSSLWKAAGCSSSYSFENCHMKKFYSLFAILLSFSPVFCWDIQLRKHFFFLFSFLGNQSTGPGFQP